MRILFISSCFPPKNCPECLQAARYFYSLPKEEFEITVVTTTSENMKRIESPFLEKYDKGWKEKYVIPIFDKWTWLNRYGKYVFPFWFGPDNGWSFHLKWRQVFNKMTPMPHLIYARATPVSSLILAWKIGKKTGIPIIIHFSDPFYKSPVPHPLNFWYDKRIERKLIEAAALVTFTTAKTKEFYALRYPGHQQKFRVTPNVCDDELVMEHLPVQKNAGNEEFRIIYTGSLNGSRGVHLIYRALQSDAWKNNSRLQNVRFIFAGTADRENTEMFNKHPALVHKGSMTFEESMKLQSSADAFLVIDHHFKDPSLAMFFPSKLLDYIVWKKPIMAITNTGSSTYEAVEKLGNFSVDHSDVSGFIYLVERIIDTVPSGLDFDKITKEFSASENAINLGKYFKEISVKI